MTQENAEKTIRNAWIAGVISGAVTLVFSMITMAGVDIYGIDAWTLIDVVLIFGLTFGIYKKSRTAASIMLAYWVASKLFLLAAGVGLSSLVVAVLFGYYFLQGVRGTFAYQNLAKVARTDVSNVESQQMDCAHPVAQQAQPYDDPQRPGAITGTKCF